MKRPRVPLPEEAEEEGSGEEGDKGGAAPEQQAVRASSRIRTPAMKAEGSDFILTHELGRKAPRLTGGQWDFASTFSCDSINPDTCSTVQMHVQGPSLQLK